MQMFLVIIDTTVKNQYYFSHEEHKEEYILNRNVGAYCIRIEFLYRIFIQAYAIRTYYLGAEYVKEKG